MKNALLVIFGSAIMMACAKPTSQQTPPQTTILTPRDIAAARDVIAGEWQCKRENVGEGLFVFRRDFTGEQRNIDLSYDSNGRQIVAKADTKLNWDIVLEGKKVHALKLDIFEIDMHLISAIKDGIDAAKSRRFREKFTAEFEGKAGSEAGFKVNFADENRLILENPSGINVCRRVGEA